LLDASTSGGANAGTRWEWWVELFVNLLNEMRVDLEAGSQAYGTVNLIYSHQAASISAVAWIQIRCIHN